VAPLTSGGGRKIKEEEKEGYSKLAVNELEPVTPMFATVPE
jgi:hypothetical protein